MSTLCCATRLVRSELEARDEFAVCIWITGVELLMKSKELTVTRVDPLTRETNLSHFGGECEVSAPQSFCAHLRVPQTFLLICSRHRQVHEVEVAVSS